MEENPVAFKLGTECTFFFVTASVILEIKFEENIKEIRVIPKGYSEAEKERQKKLWV